MADGPMTKATRAAVRAVRATGVDKVDEAKAQLAIELAKALDEKPMAALARELRSTLSELPMAAKEASVVDDLAKRRAARIAGTDVSEPAGRDRVVGGTGSRRAGGKRGSSA